MSVTGNTSWSQKKKKMSNIWKQSFSIFRIHQRNLILLMYPQSQLIQSDRQICFCTFESFFPALFKDNSKVSSLINKAKYSIVALSHILYSRSIAVSFFYNSSFYKSSYFQVSHKRHGEFFATFFTDDVFYKIKIQIAKNPIMKAMPYAKRGKEIASSCGLHYVIRKP